MIPLTLEMEAFLAFHKYIRLDFSLIRDDKIFLITGKTGSGKTSIFDAICFALYGEASGSQRDNSQLKSQFADELTECYVKFSFENKGKRYEIKRTPAQMKQRRNGNCSLQNATALLTLEDGTIISKIGEVNKQIEEILGLNAEQFRKIIMLPQGEFRRFLHDSSVGKQEILRKIFGTSLLEQFTEQLKLKDMELQQKISNINLQQKTSLYNIATGGDKLLEQELNKEFPDILLIYQLIKKYTRTLSEKAKQYHGIIQKLSSEIHTTDLQVLKQQNQKFDNWERLKQEYENLMKQSEQINQKKQLTQKLGYIKELQAIYRTLQSLIQKEKQAKEEQHTLSCEFREVLRVFSKLNVGYEDQLKINEKIQEMVQQIADKKQQLNWFAQLEQLNAQQDHIQKQYQILKSYEALFILRGKLEEYQSVKKRLQGAIDCANGLQELSVLLQKNYGIYMENNQYFMENQAYFIAKELKTGVACPVCGSIEHPSPAKNKSKKNVTKEILDKSAEVYEKTRKDYENKKSDLKAEITPLLAIIGKMVTPETHPVDEILSLLKQREDTYIQKEQEVQQQIDQITLPVNTKYDVFVKEDFTNRFYSWERRQEENSEKIKEIADIISKQQLNKEQIQQEIQSLRKYISENTKKFRKLSKQINEVRTQRDHLAEALSQNQKLTIQYQLDISEYEGNYRQLLKERNLSEEEFFSLQEQFSNWESYRQEIIEFDTQRITKEQKLQNYAEELKGKEKLNIEQIQARLHRIEIQKTECEKSYELMMRQVNNNEKVLEQLDQIRQETEKYAKQYQAINQLYTVASGKQGDKVSFERYILGVYFDQVIDQANQRLDIMSDSRYFLKRRKDKEKGNTSSGLDLEIFDSYSGKYRHVNTLSGGESFKTALCLALGLADVITQKSGGVEINTIFIDEGFGSLDRDALDTAVECLYTLKNHGRYVGIISHVSQLQEQIPVKLLVNQGKDGSTAGFLSN